MTNFKGRMTRSLRTAPGTEFNRRDTRRGNGDGKEVIQAKSTQCRCLDMVEWITQVGAKSSEFAFMRPEPAEAGTPNSGQKHVDQSKSRSRGEPKVENEPQRR